MTEQKTVFHFWAFVLVYFLQYNLGRYTRLTQAYSGFGLCAGIQTLLPHASSLSYCSIFDSMQPTCLIFSLYYEYLRNNTDVTDDVCHVCLNHSHPHLFK